MPGIAANRITAKKVALRERIGPLRKLERQLKRNVNRGWEVHSMPLLHRRLEANLLRSPDCRLIQSVPQSLHDSIDLYLPGSQENDVQQDLTLDPESPR